MTDNEMLELAAKAAGIPTSRLDAVYDCWDKQEAPVLIRSAWNPLTNDGDALRLAVQLRIDVRIDNTTTLCYASNGLHQQACEKHTDHADPYSDLWADPFRATRRAIVRAAAEIGKGMK